MGHIHNALQINHVKIPEQLREIDRQEAIVREYEYDNLTAITVDFGPEASDVSVDIVGKTALVIAGDDQFEFELPDNVNKISTKNGILTIER